MLKASEILKAINLKLKEQFPEVEIDSKDLSEDFNRPSFRTEIEVKTSPFMTTFKERKLVVRIYYFPKSKDKSRGERLEIQDKLEETFYLDLKVTETFSIPVDDIDFNETDGVLIASFESLTMEEIEKDLTAEMMEELEANYKK